MVIQTVLANSDTWVCFLVRPLTLLCMYCVLCDINASLGKENILCRLGQYLVCWWPGSFCHQGISSPDIGHVIYGRLISYCLWGTNSFEGLISVSMLGNDTRRRYIFMFLPKNSFRTKRVKWAVFVVDMLVFTCYIYTCVSLRHTCEVTMDISGSPIEIQWGSWKYPGQLYRYATESCQHYTSVVWILSVLVVTHSFKGEGMIHLR